MTSSGTRQAIKGFGVLAGQEKPCPDNSSDGSDGSDAPVAAAAATATAIYSLPLNSMCVCALLARALLLFVEETNHSKIFIYHWIYSI